MQSGTMIRVCHDMPAGFACFFKVKGVKPGVAGVLHAALQPPQVCSALERTVGNPRRSACSHA